MLVAVAVIVIVAVVVVVRVTVVVVAARTMLVRMRSFMRGDLFFDLRHVEWLGLAHQLFERGRR